MIDFDQKNCNSIKSIALKSDLNVNVTSRFINGKMLTFAKVSLRSFIYDMIDVFCFPNETAKEIYARYDIKKCHLYLNLTNTNNCSLFFIFTCEKECNIPESESRKIIFEVLKQLKTAARLDVSDQFWSQF